MGAEESAAGCCARKVPEKTSKMAQKMSRGTKLGKQEIFLKLPSSDEEEWRR
jgi:hypothetical protein